jgi:DNA primase
MKIPDEKVEEVKAATDIVEVVSDYVALKRAGTNFKGLCPFHSEKTPSFNVNPERGIYKCFGCDAGGDAISFVERIEGMGFVDAVRLLAERAGIALPEDGPADPLAGETESILHALRFAARYYFQQLTQTEEGRQRGLEYFRQRGFSAETIRSFGLGYAPAGWDSLLKEAAREHIRVEILEKAGLVLERREGKGHYDRFRGRVLFPIQTHVGKVVGFGARQLDNDPKQPKYINSPEGRVYHKGRVIYGLYHAKQAIRGSSEVILVEGYTDVISLHQAGVENVVAASGTALTVEQVRMLARYAERFVLLFDADSAGAAAAERSIDIVLREGLPAYVVSLPESADPDSFVQKFGARAFREYVQRERMSFVAFRVERARREGLLETPEGQMNTAQGIFKTIASIPDDPRYYVMWDGYVRQAAQLLGIPDMHLRRQFPRLIREAGRASDAPPRAPTAPAGEGSAAAQRTRVEMRPEEGALVRLMLEHGTPMVEFVLGHMALVEFTEGPVRETVRHLLAQYEAGDVRPEAFTRGELGREVQELAAGVLVDRHTASAHWQRTHGIRVPSLNEEPFEAAASSMGLLKLDRIEEAIAECQQASHAAEQAGEDVTPHLTALQELYAMRKQIASRAFINSET